MLLTFVFGFFLTAFLQVHAQIVLKLDGDGWTVTNTNQSIKIPATVPGGVYTDLQRGGIIGDPYFRFNDVEYRWVALDNWTFSRSFEASDDLLAKERVVLKFDGLDTVAEVILNGQHLGMTRNMFVRYVFDVKNVLRTGQNELEVRFQSAVQYAKEKHLEHLQKYLVPPTCPPPVQRGECHANFIRKMQSSFSWDWGPAFPSQGIWKEVAIEAYNSAVFEDVTVFTNLDKSGDGDVWHLNINGFVGKSSSSSGGNIEVKLEDAVLATRPVSFQNKTSLNGSFNLSVVVLKTQAIELWWPSGYGKQRLYNLTVTYMDGAEVSSVTKRIGFRTVELVQDNVTQAGVSGQTFYFRINGVPVFAKGSNLIPLDAFPERVTPGYVRWLMQSTVDANMNMLRIWGGGMYENDVVYDLADELGILLWQDLMFACALYPVEDDFLKSVTVEVTQQVRRLQSHPSVCLWSGNNENEAAIAQYWWPQIARDLAQYKADYVKLYVDTIGAIVESEDPTRPFLTSSPTNGLPSERAGDIDENPANELFGDVHYYDYLNDGWNWTIYPRPRFASEYGFQSFPSFESLSNVSVATDWTFPTNLFLDHRQHHLAGNLEMQTSIRRQFNLSSQEGGVKRFADFLYLTQVAQAMSVKTESEHYRRSRSDLVDGKGQTMGALYWQLNDIWQGASWSSIEYGGKWKMLHYFAKDFFAPVLVSPYLDGNKLKTSIVSDLTNSVNLTLNVSVYDWSSFTPKYATNSTFQQAAQSAKVVSEILVSDLLRTAGCQSEKTCFVFFRLFGTESQEPLSTNYVVLAPFKKVAGLAAANIQIKATKEVSPRLFEVVVESTRIAPFVWLEASGVLGTFSSNGFLMVEPIVTLNFTSTRDISVSDLQQALTVQSLMDTQTNSQTKEDLISVLLNQDD